MATVNRVNGNSGGVRNVDAGAHTANATIVNTGISAPLTAFKITGLQSDGGLSTPNLGAELGAPNGSGVSAAVETILRAIAGNASVLAYQVESTGQVSVLVERSAWSSDAQVKTAIGSGNIGAYGNCYVGAITTVSSSGGLKLG